MCLPNRHFRRCACKIILQIAQIVEVWPAKLVHGVRMLSEANPDFIVVKCDIRNAFNSVSRGKVLEVMDSEDELRHLVWHAALSLASPNTLESGGKVWLCLMALLRYLLVRIKAMLSLKCTTQVLTEKRVPHWH